MWEGAGGYVYAVNIWELMWWQKGDFLLDTLRQIMWSTSNLYFSPLSSIALTSVVEFPPPLFLLSMVVVIPTGIDVWGGNEAEDEFCPYVLIPCLCNKTLSEMIALMSRKTMKSKTVACYENTTNLYNKSVLYQHLCYALLNSVSDSRCCASANEEHIYLEWSNTWWLCGVLGAL